MSECERIRDLIPERVAGRLDAVRSAQVDAHIAACAECAAEYALVMTMRRHPVHPPAQLEARVLSALATPIHRRPWSMAIAAGLTMAIGAAVILERTGRAPAPVPEEQTAGPVLIWPATEEPLMHGAPSLSELSVEELEALLEELDS